MQDMGRRADERATERGRRDDLWVVHSHSEAQMRIENADADIELINGERKTLKGGLRRLKSKKCIKPLVPYSFLSPVDGVHPFHESEHLFLVIGGVDSIRRVLHFLPFHSNFILGCHTVFDPCHQIASVRIVIDQLDPQFT